MIAALFYLQYQSARNRLVTRFKRLQQPKYLIGAIAGGLYFYWYFYRTLFLGNSRSPGFTLTPEHRAAAESLAAGILFIIVVLAWLIPHERAALTFTEAEVAFLFPAPVSRRTLVHFKLIRSQLRILFSSLFFTLLSHRFGGGFWIHAAGWWIILSTLNLHFMGASFARTLLLDHGVSNRLRRLLVFGLVVLMVGGVWYWARKTLPSAANLDPTDFDSTLNYLQTVLTSGPALYLLYPFRLVVRPFFAPDSGAFFMALLPALLFFVLHYFWVILSDVAFEEASVEASQKLAARLVNIRSGNWAAARKNQKPRRSWFKLAPAGPAFIALLWKNLIGLSGVFSLRFFIIIAIILTISGFAFRSGGGQNLSVLAAIIVTMLLGYSLMLGPQFLRLDFRRDLAMADILKTFPLPAWQIALGEVLAPAVVLAGFQWLLLLPVSLLIFYLPINDQQPLLFALTLSAALLLPVLDFILLLIPNAAVLLFPSWVQTGKDASRGIEATGQRLIFAVGQMLVLLLALVPAAFIFAAVYFPMKYVLGSVTPIVFASLASAIILAVEAGLGILLLGKLFEKFDVTEETAA
jgi:ABC-2 type transport system permease protein